MTVELAGTIPETGGVVAAENRTDEIVAKAFLRYNLALSKRDIKRLGELQERYDCQNKSTMARTLCERVMTLIPDSENVPPKYVKQIQKFVKKIQDESATEFSSFSPVVGNLYRDYIHAISKTLELESAAIFFRAIILMIHAREI